MLGLSFAAFTALHVAISLAGIGAGLVAIGGMLAGQWLGGWTALFLATTALTSVTGFMFPGSAFGAAHAVGVLSLIALVPAAYALYGRGLESAWRRIYIASAVAALYLNCFVGLVQTFQKQPALAELAPTQGEPPFVAAQLLLLAVFVWLGVMVTRRFRSKPPGERTAATGLAA
ncbi:hypothetical protein [Falsiroseomonas oryzae]|uniref:hypothetical protein n=1 Tax=Falsiroseomonas oryzae TaxID=2766473 RepID=UPI0022EB4BAC|nr:hypothetical protein [Roseomonas sp. MO-31]